MGRSPIPRPMTRIRFGSFRRRAIDRGANASGGDTIAPNRKPTGQGAQSDMGRHGDRGGRENHTAESKQRYRAQVEAKIAPTHGDRSPIDNWRQQDQEYDFGRDFNSGKARN